MPRLSMTVAAFLTIAAPLATATSSFAQKPADKPEQAQSNSDKAEKPAKPEPDKADTFNLDGLLKGLKETTEKEIKEEEKPASPREMNHAPEMSISGAQNGPPGIPPRQLARSCRGRDSAAGSIRSEGHARPYPPVVECRVIRSHGLAPSHVTKAFAQPPGSGNQFMGQAT